MNSRPENTGTVFPHLWGNEEPRLDDRAAGAYIRGLLNDNSPDGTPPEAFGEYRDVIEVLHQAHAAGRTSSVHVAWNGIVQRRPELAALVSGDHPSGLNHATSAPACPEVLWRGRFAAVADALGKRSWEIWAGTFAAPAAIAHRHVHLRYHSPLYGMAYVLLVKPTGLGKSECTHTCRALLPATYVVRDAVQSGPALALVLAEIERDKRGQVRQVRPRPAILVIEEWTTLLKNMSIQNSTLMDTLNTLFHRAWPWNVSRSDRPGAGGDLVIPDPALSICATTTTSLLTQHVGEGLIRAGFLNRYLVLPGSCGPWRFYHPDAAGLEYGALAGLLDDLVDQRWMGGNVWDAYTAEARAHGHLGSADL
jgi:lambda repressor-like predicted transcriptional regulator